LLLGNAGTRSVYVMTVWDELRPILTQLREENRETLLEFPDPRHGESEPPPYQITLAPTAVAVAEDLHRRFGDNVQLTVGRLPYPPGRQPDPPLEDLILQPPGELLGPQEAEVQLHGPAIVQSGETLRHGLLVRNLTSQVLPIATNGNVTAVVLDPQTHEVVGGFAGAQTMPLIMFRVAPGNTERIPLLIGTASFRTDLGYAVPPGSWGIHVPLDLEWDPYTREQRYTPVLPLTITA
jgi:hypothetical protein